MDPVRWVCYSDRPFSSFGSSHHMNTVCKLFTIAAISASLFVCENLAAQGINFRSLVPFRQNQKQVEPIPLTDQAPNRFNLKWPKINLSLPQPRNGASEIQDNFGESNFGDAASATIESDNNGLLRPPSTQPPRQFSNTNGPNQTRFPGRFQGEFHAYRPQEEDDVLDGSDEDFLESVTLQPTNPLRKLQQNSQTFFQQTGGSVNQFFRNANNSLRKSTENTKDFFGQAINPLPWQQAKSPEQPTVRPPTRSALNPNRQSIIRF